MLEFPHTRGILYQEEKCCSPWFKKYFSLLVIGEMKQFTLSCCLFVKDTIVKTKHSVSTDNMKITMLFPLQHMSKGLFSTVDVTRIYGAMFMDNIAIACSYFYWHYRWNDKSYRSVVDWIEWYPVTHIFLELSRRPSTASSSDVSLVHSLTGSKNLRWSLQEDYEGHYEIQYAQSICIYCFEEHINAVCNILPSTVSRCQLFPVM